MPLGYIGVLTVRLEMPWVSSLKEKRSMVRPVVEKLKARFPVTAARLDGLDAHDWEVIGVITLSNNYQWIQETLQLAADFVAQGEYRVADECQDILTLDEYLTGDAESLANWTPVDWSTDGADDTEDTAQKRD